MKETRLVVIDAIKSQTDFGRDVLSCLADAGDVLMDSEVV